mmetsp:Transcript_49254/g.122373  ORF Transcript_49254/g.122373 Transcript_49254/m.122373 type:complete len:235 (+) Transcript_49254:1441-2145(+)
MRGVPRLEGVHHVRALLLEGGAKLVDGEAVLVKAIAVLDAAEQLHLAAHRERLAGREEQLDVRVLVVDHAPRARDDLAYAQLVHLRQAQDGQRHPRGVGEGDCLRVLNLAPREVSDRQYDGYWHRDALAGEGRLHPVGLAVVVRAHAREVVRVDEHRVEVQRLEQCAFAHEAPQRRSPPLADHLQPVHVDVRQRHRRQLGSFRQLGGQLVRGDDQVDVLATVGYRKPIARIRVA